jgi:hypothetical protein
VDRARTEERSIVRAWAMRGTIHLLNADDAAWMLPLFEPAAIAFSRRRLPQLGMDMPTVDRALATFGKALRAGEPVARSELAMRLASRGIELTVETRIHIFRLAVAERVACFGPDAGGEPCLIAPAAWFGERPRIERAAALEELARRYFKAFGPATEADYAGWAGLPLRDIRPGLAAIGAELREYGEIGGRPAWTLGVGARRAKAGTLRFLPGWDTYTMGYRDRDFFATPELWKRVLVGGGVIKPIVLADGVAVGLWRSERKGRRLVVKLEPFAKLDAAMLDAIQAEVADLGRFEGAEAELAA